MCPAKRTLLTLTLALLVVSVALLAALAAPTRAAPMTAHALHAFSLEDPAECPPNIGYALVSVADDPATNRFGDQNTDGMVCVRIARTCIPSSVLTDDDSSGDPHGCPLPFVLISLERLPNRELVSDVRLVDRDGNSLACLYQAAELSSVIVIDNSSAPPTSRASGDGRPPGARQRQDRIPSLVELAAPARRPTLPTLRKGWAS